MVPDLNEVPLVVVLLTGLAALCGAAEIGRRFGSRARERGGDSSSTLEAAMLGLLALMIGFTFSIALARYEARRDAVLNEANLIGTAALRALLLPAPHDETTLKLLRDYLQIRIELAAGNVSAEKVSTAISRSNEVQKSLWREVKSTATDDKNMVPTGIFITTLNELIDNQENLLIAAQSHLPRIVLVALYGIAITALFFCGYNRGIQRLRTHIPINVMAVIIAAIVLLIQDLDRPSSGFITTDKRPLTDLAANFPPSVR